MPEKLERCVREVMKSGKSKDSAYAICTANLKRQDELKRRTDKHARKDKGR